MTTAIAIYSQKGGAGKTTLTANLAAAFASQGAAVLTIDLDSSASLSISLGFDEEVYMEPAESVYTWFAVKHGDPNRMIRKAPNDDFDVLPGDTRIHMADTVLQGVREREKRLTVLLNKIRKPYDYILVDCSPALDAVSDNALMACRRVLIPARMRQLYLDNLPKLYAQIEDLEERYRVDGVSIGVLAVAPVGYMGTPDEKAFYEGLEEAMPNAVAPPLRWKDTILHDARDHGHTVFTFKSAKPHRRLQARQCQENFLEVMTFVQDRLNGRAP